MVLPLSAFSRDNHTSVSLYVDYKALAFRQNGVSSAFEGTADNANRRGGWKQSAENCCFHCYLATMTDSPKAVTAIREFGTCPHRNTRKVNGHRINHDP